MRLNRSRAGDNTAQSFDSVKFLLVAPGPPAASDPRRRHHDDVDAEDFRQVRDAVRALVRESVIPREEQIEDEDRIPDELRAQAADMGLFGYALPEEYGGLGVNMTEDVQL